MSSISICETVHHLVARSVLAIIHDDTQVAAGPLQLCAGQLPDYETAVHCARRLFLKFSKC